MSALTSQCAGCPKGRRSGEWSLPQDDAVGIDHVVALAGNPNTGKSTVFNALTGLRQHTGNWPGKTVTRAEGTFRYHEETYRLIDLPGTYSLMATSQDEEVARDFLLFGNPDVTVIVVDATRLERNLNLTLQVLEITDRAVVCLNLMDEAKRHGVIVDDRALAEELGVPVVPASARSGVGIDRLKEVIEGVATGRLETAPRRAEYTNPSLRTAVARLKAEVAALYPELKNPGWVALRLLDGDVRIAEAVKNGTLAERSIVRQPAAPGSVATLTQIGPPRARVERLLALASELRWEIGGDYHQAVVESLYAKAEVIAQRVATRDPSRRRFDWDRALDRVLTSRWTGFPVMLALLGLVLWLTIIGSNYPSQLLSAFLLDTVHPLLKQASAAMRVPWWLDGLLVDGVYLATAWVVSVMLPPMAIFFPLFTLLEDFGYLPRVAFNLDRAFKRVGAHGKQALSMCMGLGCNAAGVVSTRIIDSPRERLIAIITNNFSLCNGRWPTQILLATIFLGAMVPAQWAGAAAAGAVMGVALLGMLVMLLTSWLLSRTVLRGEPSSFALELPPYRPPRILQTLYTSLIDRTLIVLGRAVMFAIPAGAAIWLICNVQVGGASIAEHAIRAFNPFGILVGLNGVILLAYIVAIPANEIVIPTILMLTALSVRAAEVGSGAGVMFELDSAQATGDLLRAGGWTTMTAVCVMLFSLLHNPCSTTIYTIWKETHNARWTALAALLPLVMGFTACFVVAQAWRLVASG